jgi:hypothetical protein
MVLWTLSVRSLRCCSATREYLAYAALDGYFFRVFRSTSSDEAISLRFADRAWMISIICSFFSLDTVIDALISTRILVQFIGQIGADTAQKTCPEHAAAI